MSAFIDLAAFGVFGYVLGDAVRRRDLLAIVIGLAGSILCAANILARIPS